MRIRDFAFGALFTSLALAGCQGRDLGKGGGTVQPNGSFAGLYVANPDHDTLTRLDPKTGAWSKIQVGQEPTRIAQFEGTVYVTNRAERKVAILVDDGERLQLAGEIRTGAEPFGVAATKDRVYVSASVSGEVIEYDAQSHARLRAWSIDGEPRGLTLHESGKTLLVAQTYGGQFASIDLDSGELRMIELPEAKGFDFETGAEFSFSRRITGDPTYSPDGTQVAIPALYVDNHSTIFDPNDEPDTGAAPPPGEDDARVPPGGPGGGYQDRMNPTVVVAPVDENGQPVIEEAVAVSAQSFEVFEDVGGFNARQVNAYPVAVSISKNGIMLVSLKGADAVVALDLDSEGFAQRNAGDAAPGFIDPGGRGFMFLPNVAVSAGAGPDGLAIFDDGRAYVHALFDNTIEHIDMTAIEARLRNTGGSTEPVGPGEAPEVPEQLTTLSKYQVESNRFPAHIERGRRLFFSTKNRQMSADGAGVSCATCHFNGRTDGLTWTFGRGLRQTPSLAGDVSLAEPVGWQGDRPTVAEDAMMTSQGLMGGDGLTEQDALDIAAFVNSTRDVDNPFTDDISAIARGKAVFERPDVACVSCHSGPAYTNNAVVPMFELEAAKVRPLTGIAMTAPYFHDGSAPTLRDVLERSRDGSMGNTSALSDAEMDDLVTYLKSL